MKRVILPFLLVLIFCLIWVVFLETDPNIVEGTETTATMVVTDRAMSDGMPYLGVELSDGSGLCLWDPTENIIPDDISINDTVQVTYGKQNGFDRYIVLQINK